VRKTTILAALILLVLSGVKTSTCWQSRVLQITGLSAHGYRPIPLHTATYYTRVLTVNNVALNKSFLIVLKNQKKFYIENRHNFLIFNIITNAI
jgi:hypothetical protein